MYILQISTIQWFDFAIRYTLPYLRATWTYTMSCNLQNYTSSLEINNQHQNGDLFLTFHGGWNCRHAVTKWTNLWSFVDSTLRPASTESLAILLHTAPAINTDGRHYLSFNIIINQECCHLLRMILMHHILTTKWMQTEVASTVMPLLFGMSLVTEEVSSWWSYRCPLANCQHTLKSFKKWSESTITINPLILL